METHFLIEAETSDEAKAILTKRLLGNLEKCLEGGGLIVKEVKYYKMVGETTNS